MKSMATIAMLLALGGTAVAEEVTTEIKVKGMTCGSCVAAVHKALTRTKGVKSAEVSLEKNMAKVVYEDTQAKESDLREAIKKAGFKAEPAS